MVFQYRHRWGVSDACRTGVVPASMSSSCRTSRPSKKLRCPSFISHNPAWTFLDLNSLFSHHHLIGNVNRIISLNERYFKSIFRFNLLMDRMISSNSSLIIWVCEWVFYSIAWEAVSARHKIRMLRGQIEKTSLNLLFCLFCIFPSLPLGNAPNIYK